MIPTPIKPTTPATPVPVPVDATVDVPNPADTFPVRLTIGDDETWLTPEEAIDLADQLTRAAVRARGLDKPVDELDQ